MTQIEEYQSFLWTQEEKISKALPSHLTVKRFISSACAYIEKAPKLLECDRRTLIASIMRAGQMGLLIDGIESALVPRKQNVTLMVMFQGLLKLCRNSGELKDIQSAVVYEKDEFDYYTDETGEHLKHRRTWGDRGARKLVFAVARTKDGGTYVEVMDATQVDAVKKQGYNNADSPWNGPFQDEMWRKSAIRRLAKRLPSSTDMESFSQAIHEDDDLFVDPKPQEDAPKTTNEPAVSSKLAEAVRVAPAPAHTPAPAPTAFKVSGQIQEYKVLESGDTKRFVVKIDGVSYGTCDTDLGAVLKTMHEFQSEVALDCAKIAGAGGKEINEIIDIGNQHTQKEMPI